MSLQLPFPPRAAALAVLGLVTACRPAPEAPAPLAARAVRVVPLHDSVVARPVTGAGALAPRDELPLSFKIGGVVTRVLVDAGDRVQAGQLLATLDPREIDAGVSKAASAVEKAERDLARAQRLYGDSVVTLAQLQDARTGVEVARADLEAAQFNQRYARIVAPASGTILGRQAAAGELVSAGAPVLLLGSQARGTVFRVDLVDRDVVRVRRSALATVQLDAYPTRTFRGTVTEIAAAPTPGTGTYAVQISLPDATGLATGLVGRAEVAASAAEAVTIVPVEAVVEADGDRAVVYILGADRKATRREVEVAFVDGSRLGVRGALAGASTVITEGAAYLNDGDAVRVVQ